MHRRESADDGMIADLNMAGQRPVIGENDRIADVAIVRDVAVGEKVSAVAHSCFALAVVLRLTVQNSRNVLPSPISR